MKHLISRRNFISGLGAGLAVSNFLHPSKLFAQTARAPMRLLFIAVEHGWGHTSRNPQVAFSGDASNWAFKDALAPLNAIKNDCVFIDGVRGTTWGNAHDVSYSDFLTHSVPFEEGSSAQLGPHPEPMGPSIDWYIAKQLNSQVLRMDLGMGKGVSFSDARQRQGMFGNAEQAYDALIADFIALKGGGNSQTQKQKFSRKELLGLAKAQLSGMDAISPKASKSMIGNYLTSVQNLETALMSSLAAGNPLVNETLPTRVTSGQSREVQLDACYEMLRLAFLGGTHQIGVLTIGDWAGSLMFPWVDSAGVTRYGDPTTSGFHHGVAHYEETANPESIYCFRGYVQYHIRKVMAFVEKLRTTIDVDGRSLLDNTLIVLNSEIGDGQHETFHKGVTLIGGGRGQVGRGKLILPERFSCYTRNGYPYGGQRRDGSVVEHTGCWIPTQTKHTEADLSVALARLMGVNINKFGFDINNHQPLILG